MLPSRMTRFAVVQNVFWTSRLLCLRNFVASPSQFRKLDSNKKKLSSAQTKEQIKEYFSACAKFNEQVEALPKNLLKRCKQPEFLQLMDERVAKKIVDCFGDDIVSNGAPVFESCPSMGLLTTELLKVGASSITLFEGDKNLKRFSQDLISQYPNKLRLFNSNFLQLWRISYSDLTVQDNKFKQLMDVVKVKKWDDNVSLNLLTPLTNLKFLNHIIYNVIFQSGVVAYGRPKLFLIVTPKVLLKLRNEGKYGNQKSAHRFTTLCNLLFDITFCETVERKAFLPWQSLSDDLDHLSEDSGLDAELLYMVKMSPKRELLVDMNPNTVKLLWFFVRHHLNNRNNRIIPQMEEWVPGCGPRLIRRGFGIFSQFSDLSSDQLLELFLDFQSWPEFPYSSFIPAMESTTLKMFSPSDLDIAVDDSSIASPD